MGKKERMETFYKGGGHGGTGQKNIQFGRKMINGALG